jgi:type II secretory pathway pseudopilin PulG
MACQSRYAFAKRTPRKGGTDGFALVEVLVAFVVLAIGLGALLGGVLVAMHTETKVHATRDASRVAQSLLAEAGVLQKLTPGLRTGTISSFRWYERIVPARFKPPSATKPDNPAARGDEIYWVEIRVVAPDGITTELSALKAGAGS